MPKRTTLPTEPRARFRVQANIRVAAATTALDRVAKMICPEIPAVDREVVIAELDQAIKRVRQSFEAGKYGAARPLFPDSEAEDAEPDAAEDSEPEAAEYAAEVVEPEAAEPDPFG